MRFSGAVALFEVDDGARLTSDPETILKCAWDQAAGSVTRKRAPPSARFSAAMRPPCASTIQCGDREPQSAPALGRVRRTPEAVEHVCLIPGPIPGRSSSTSSTATSPSRRTLTRLAPPSRAWRMALSSRSTTSCSSRSASPFTLTGEISRPIVTPTWSGQRSHRIDRKGGGLGQVGLHQVNLGSVGVGTSEDEQLVDERGDPVEARLDLVDRRRPLVASGGVRAGLRAIDRPQQLDVPRMIASGVRSSWLASAVNSRWRRSESRMGTSARPA